MTEKSRSFPARPSHVALAGAAAVWVLLSAAACGGPEGSSIDLVEALPAAEMVREVGLIDLGTLEARPHLADGWSVDETHRDGTTMVWAVGERSEIRFFLAEPRALGLVLRCSPYSQTTPRRQRVEVAVNGHAIESLPIPAGLRDTAVTLEERYTVAGENLIELRFAGTGRPSEHGRLDDDRELAARFDVVRLAGALEAAAPSVDRDGHRIVIPAGAEVAFFLEPDGPSTLSWEAFEQIGDVRLEVWWRADGTAERLVGSVGEPQGKGRIELPDATGGPVRLGLRAAGSAGEVGMSAPRASWRPQAAARGREGPPEPAAASAPRPNVLIYLVDTLRADRLGCYGSSSGLTLQADAMAAEGVQFAAVAAQSSWTKPSVASILTGLRPGRHGVNHRLSVLPDAAVTAAELLRDQGYETAGFSTNAYITRDGGFAQGFDHFSFRVARAHAVTEEVVGWLDGREPGRPFFLYVHTVDPHAPYEPAPEFRQRFAGDVADREIGTFEHLRALGDRRAPCTPEVVRALLQLYDAEVAENDAALGELVRALQERGLWEGTLAVFVSDHGEEFREHGVFGHGWDLYNEVLDVPLIVRAPGCRRGVRVEEVVQHVDILPTVLDAVGAPIPGGADGVSLWPVIRDGGAPAPRPAFSYLDYEGRRGISVRDGRWKLIEPLSRNFTPGRELYDRVADPAESDDLSRQLPVRSGLLASWCREEMGRHGTGLPEIHGGEADGEIRRALEALGYLR